MGIAGHARPIREWRLHARFDGDRVVAVGRDWQLGRVRPDLPLIRVDIVVDDQGGAYYGWYGNATKVPAYLTPDLGELEATLDREGCVRAEGTIRRFTIRPEQYGPGQ